MILTLPSEDRYYIYKGHKTRISKSSFIFTTYMYEDDNLENNNFIDITLTIIFMLQAKNTNEYIKV